MANSHIKASSLNMYRLFAHDGEPRVNSLGDEVRPVDVSVEKWVSARLYDSMGKYSTPLKFALEAGRTPCGWVWISRWLLRPSACVPLREIRPYSEVLADWKASGCRNASQKNYFLRRRAAVNRKTTFPLPCMATVTSMRSPRALRIRV